MNFSHVPYRARKKKAVLLLKNSRHIVFLVVFSCMIVQPQRFFVEPPARDISQSVYASYDLLLEQSRQQNGMVMVDNVVVSDDGQTTITYKVVAGDTLSSIAQDFGTTVQELVEKNGIQPSSTLRKGQELIISFTENFVYQVQEDSTLEAFANKYDLNINDLMHLNYLSPPSVMIYAEQELVLPLTRAEAKIKGLVGVEEFVPLDIEFYEEPTREEVELPAEQPETIQEQPDRSLRGTDQEIISAEETERRLQGLQEQQAQLAAEQQARQEAQERETVAQQQAREQAEQARQEALKKQQELAAIKEKAPSSSPSEDKSCNENQCLHNGSCYTKPAHAVCAPQDRRNAWTCEAGYTDTGRSCVKQTTAQATTSQAANKKVSLGVISQRYFNARNAGYPNNRGRAPGHCTQYVDYRRWKNLGVQTHRRGNANRWYTNAANAGASVGKTPQYGAAAVFAAGTNSYRGYGHVAVVIDIDNDNNLILVEEQNYVGTYIVSQRRVSMNQPIGYVYPSK